MPRGPQVARSADRELLAAARELLAKLPPENARGVELGVSVFRRTQRRPVFEARGFVQWVSARGKPGAAGFDATGLDPGGANVALAALIEKLRAAPAAAPAPARTSPRRARPRHSLTGAGAASKKTAPKRQG